LYFEHSVQLSNPACHSEAHRSVGWFFNNMLPIISGLIGQPCPLPTHGIKLIDQTKNLTKRGEFKMATRILTVYNKNDARIFERPIADELFGEYGVLGYAKSDIRAIVRLVDEDITTIKPEVLVTQLKPAGTEYIGRLKSAQPEPTPVVEEAPEPEVIDYGPTVFDDIGPSDEELAEWLNEDEPDEEELPEEAEIEPQGEEPTDEEPPADETTITINTRTSEPTQAKNWKKWIPCLVILLPFSCVGGCFMIYGMLRFIGLDF
jgi:hypothetical protein